MGRSPLEAWSAAAAAFAAERLGADAGEVDRNCQSGQR